VRTGRKIIRRGQRVRVLAVDDSVVVRRLIANAIEPDAQLELVGVAMDGQMAVEKMRLLKPDVITMDIEMPKMNGIEAVKAIRRENLDVRILMFSTLTERGAAITLEALSAGADDSLLKIAGESNVEASTQRLRQELLPRVKQFFQFEGDAAGAGGSSGLATPERARPVAVRWTGGPAAARHVVAIGISTGGPKALETLLPRLPKDFPLPVLIVQHMPPVFTKMLAERLNGLSPLRVTEAQAGDLIEAGRVLIAPGNFHMRVAGASGTPRVVLDQGAPVNSCRPAVDVLFQSLADAYGAGVVGAVLTGMGSDGQAGAAALKKRGGYVLAQDEATSVVWGMPGAVVAAQLADAVLPLGEIAGALQDLARPRALPGLSREEPSREPLCRA